ncbi:hypothetical protein NC651_023755 [Populus alba x Populus x berolinensis]|nr:hypothetical protein NC651_023755 [Populus alba x Populus x berolinensis]
MESATWCMYALVPHGGWVAIANQFFLPRPMLQVALRSTIYIGASLAPDGARRPIVLGSAPVHWSHPSARFRGGSFAVMSQEGWGLGPSSAGPRSVCFGFGVCVRTQDSWVSTLNPTEWGLANKPYWLGWVASSRVWPKCQGMTI